MTLKLYELTDQIRTLAGFLEEHGEDPASWAAAMDELTGDFQHKAVNLAKLCRTWEAEEEAYKHEITRLQGHMTGAQNRRKWAMDYLKRNMEEAGIDHIKGDVVDIRLQNGPPSVEVEDWKEVPQKYLTGTLHLPWVQVAQLGLQDTAGEPQVDKRAILADAKDGAVQGARIVQGRHVRIR